MANKGFFHTIGHVVGVRALIGTAVVATVLGLGHHANVVIQQQQTITALQQAQQQQAGSWNVVFVALNAVSYLSISSDQADSGHLDRYSISDTGTSPPLQSLTPSLKATDILVQYEKNHANGDPSDKINGIGFIKTVYHLAGQDVPAAVASSGDYWASFQKEAAWTAAPNDGSAAPLPGDIITWQNDTSDIAIVVEINSDSVIVAQADTKPNLTTPDASAPVIQAYDLHLVKLDMQNNKVASLNGHAIAGFVRNASLTSYPYDATGSAIVGSIIAYAQTKLDFPYLFGGNCAPGGTLNSHTNAQLCDCSGLVSAAYKYGANLNLPRTAAEQASTTGPQTTIGTSIPFDKLQPGDLIFPKDSWNEVQNGVNVNGFGHVGIYIGHVAADGKHAGTGDHTIIEAPHTGDVVKYDQMTTGYWGKQGSVVVQPTVLAQALAKEAAQAGTVINGLINPGIPAALTHLPTGNANNCTKTAASAQPKGNPSSQFIADCLALVRQYAAQYKIPSTYFIRQIYQESTFDPHAGSPAGAVGIAQFMPATAASHHIDPNDPAQALQEAAKMDAQTWQQHTRQGMGSALAYMMTLSDYNCGPACAGYHLDSAGKPICTWYDELPKETSDYIHIIMGIPYQSGTQTLDASFDSTITAINSTGGHISAYCYL